jgi:MSHA pilin protein MshD
MCTRLSSLSRERGLSFVELLLFIIIISVCLAGVLAAINMGALHSADPMIRKQALAAAESLLEEIELQPFTYCDPDDPSAPTAVSSAVGPTGCSAAGYSMDNTANWGAGETRYGPVFFDNVADYQNFSMAGTLNDIFQQASSSLSGYSASANVTQVGAGFGLPNADVLRIDVTVTGSGNTVTLTGFRFRHSPNLTN